MSINRRIEEGCLILENTENGEIVRIRETIDGGRAKVEPEGRLTQEAVHDLEDELTSMVLMCRQVTIDMSSVQYISNSVIHMILKIQHMMDDQEGTLKISGVGDSIWSRFQEMGLEDVFEIERTQDFLQ
ncbi:MAG: STAS domain-containing protein [Firmicutes bacterium]|nr:STAS domain-containing protein [Bacillota bacterium]